MIFIRMYLLASEQDASTAADYFMNLLSDIGTPVKETIAPYWKITGYIELCIEMDCLLDDSEAFLLVLKKLGAGWNEEMISSGALAIWNPSPGARFCNEFVRWASVELIQ